MSNISASQVKELREKTGLGLMDCKKALEGSNGDMDMAIEELRKTSGIKASKKSGRSAADGLIGIKSNGSTSFMLEVNCETDFVARDDSYIAFTSETLDIYSPMFQGLVGNRPPFVVFEIGVYLDHTNTIELVASKDGIVLADASASGAFHGNIHTVRDEEDAAKQLTHWHQTVYTDSGRFD